ncbi:MAG: SCO2322 family protein [Nocardioides sp.]
MIQKGSCPMFTLRRAVRSALLPLVTLLLAGFVSVGTAPAAHAADVYRYWAYYQVQDGAFVAAATGPAGATPKDGDVEGYRYAAPADFKNPNLPRADLAVVTFDAVCGDKTAADGEKRVAVLLDYGVEADADAGETPPDPEALCAVVPAEFNGLQTLESVAPDLRTKKSSFGPLICGISGYPATGCADVKVAQGSPADGPAVEFAGLATDDSAAGDSSDTSSASDSDSDDSNAPLLIGLGVLVVAIVAGGVVLQRRNAAR